MRSINIIIIDGNATADAELFVTKTGKSICKFKIAHNHREKNQQTGQWETVETSFWSVSYLGNDAEALVSQIKKGTRWQVTGQSKIENWEGRDGQKRQTPSIKADAVTEVPSLRPNGAVNGAPARDPWGSAPQGGFPQNEQPPF